MSRKPQGKKNNLTRQSLQLGSHTVASCRQNTDHMFSDFHKISLHMDHQKKAAVLQSNFLKSHSLLDLKTLKWLTCRKGNMTFLALLDALALQS